MESFVKGTDCTFLDFDITDGAAYAGEATAVQANTLVVFTANVKWRNATNPMTFTLEQGEVRYGGFTNITVVSGELCCFGG